MATAAPARLRTVGLLGGMTYHSTLLYYSQINAHVQRAAGGSNAASLLMHSFNFAETTALFTTGRWDAVAAKFIAAGSNMRDGGAQAIAIGCNIGHEVAERVQQGVGLPVLHIATYAAAAVRERGLKKVALLGTRVAMERDFISGPLAKIAHVEVLIPEQEDRLALDDAVFKELGKGVVTEETKALMSRVVKELVDQGAEAVVLACTDFQFVLKQEDVSVPILDTLELHTKGIADWSVAEDI